MGNYCLFAFLAEQNAENEKIIVKYRVTFADLQSENKRVEGGVFSTLSLIFGILGGIGFLVSLYFLFFSSNEVKGIYAYSWLWSFIYFLSISLGACFLLLLHHATGSGWGVICRRLMENIALLFPLFFICAIPFLFPEVQKFLWEWIASHRYFLDEGKEVYANLKKSHDPHLVLLSSKYWYLNLNFWYGRFLFYFLGLGTVIGILYFLSISQDKDALPTTDRLFLSRKISYLGLWIFGISVTFLATDWLQGLDFTWFSTMWGVYFFSGCVLGALAFLILLAQFLKSFGYLKFYSKEHEHILGKLLFAFVIFWAYIAFSQYFLIWYANITEETRFFLLRGVGNWNAILWFLVLGHFVFPFFLLLSSWVKKNSSLMTFISLYLLIAHAVDMYFIVIPERSPSLGIIFHNKPIPDLSHVWIYDVLAFVTIGSMFLFALLRIIGNSDVYPSKDPRILESVNVSN